MLPSDSPLLVQSETIHTPDREAWRKWVVEYFLSAGKPVTDRAPKFFFLGGGGGAGKTTIARILMAQGMSTAT